MKRLTRSYVENYSSEYPVQDDLTLYQIFRQAREDGHVGEIINLETGEAHSTVQIMDKADQFAKGMIAIGLEPGKSTLAVIGCSSNNAVALFVACSSIGVGYAHPYIYTPKEKYLIEQLSLVRAKLVIVGRSSMKTTFASLQNLLETTTTGQTALSGLQSVKHIYYDYGTLEEREANMEALETLIEAGKSVTDHVLESTKKCTRPEFILHHVFTSGSTGKSKCAAHTQRGLANELLLLQKKNLAPVITMNVNMDEMISYSCLAWTLAGRFEKVIMIQDLPCLNIGQLLTDAIINHKVEYILLPGSVEQAIASHIKESGTLMHPLKLFSNGAQIISRGFKEKLQQIFKCMPYTTYGMSETFMIGLASFGDSIEDEESRLDAKLHIKPNSELRIVDDKGSTVNIGETGEIQVKTYSFLKEYRTQTDKTRQLFTDDGFLRTGDAGVMFEDGSFQVRGRVADAVRFKYFGDVFYPAPIEEVLGSHCSIKNCTVISAGSNDWLGDEVTYCISLEDNAKQINESDLVEFCELNGLNEGQLPARILYFDDLPTTGNARKVSRTVLRENVRRLLLTNPTHGMTEFFKDLKHQTGATQFEELRI